METPSELAARIATTAWATTPLGDRAAWPEALETAVAIVLSAGRPMQLWWGDDLAVIYNDAFVPIMGDRHPAALGRPAREVWADRWDRIAASLAGDRAPVDELSFARFPKGWLVSVDEYAFVSALNHALRNALSPISTTIAALRLKGVPEADALARQAQQLVKVIDSIGDREPPPPPPAPAPIRDGLRLLVVEDDNEEAHTLREVLVGLGFEVALAHDGPLALSLARTFSPDLVILDLGLPVMDGYELARRLRSKVKVPIVAVTARALDADHRRSAEEGFCAHLVKPVDVSRLVAVLASATEHV